jgi:hypothetical protein
MRIANPWRVAVLIAVGAVFLEPNMATSQQAPPPELIVKFKPGSQAQEAVEEARRGGADAAATLTSTTRSLSETTEVPLSFSKLTSGREVVFAIDAQAITDQLTQFADGLEHVGAIRPAALNEGKPTFPPGPRLVLETVRGSPSALSCEHADVANCDAALRDMADTASRETGLPVQTEMLGENEILLTVDMEALTSRLLGHLKARPDVEYAQPNLMLQIRGAAAPASKFEQGHRQERIVR